jgi:hypothetical protein
MQICMLTFCAVYAMCCRAQTAGSLPPCLTPLTLGLEASTLSVRAGCWFTLLACGTTTSALTLVDAFLTGTSQNP